MQGKRSQAQAADKGDALVPCTAGHMRIILLIYFAHLGRARDDLGLVLLCEFRDRFNTWAKYLNDCSSSEAKNK